MKDRLTFGDVCVLVLLILMSAASVLYAKTALPGGTDAVVEIDGKEAIHLPLDVDVVRKAQGEKGYVVLEIKDRGVRVLESSCPNKICVDQGWVRQGVIVCLPSRILVRVGLKGSGDRRFDAITR